MRNAVRTKTASKAHKCEKCERKVHLRHIKCESANVRAVQPLHCYKIQLISSQRRTFHQPGLSPQAVFVSSLTMEFYIPDPDVSFADFPQLLSQGLDSTPLLRKPPRRLNFLKCRQCRRDKQKVSCIPLYIEFVSNSPFADSWDDCSAHPPAACGRDSDAIGASSTAIAAPRVLGQTRRHRPGGWRVNRSIDLSPIPHRTL